MRARMRGPQHRGEARRILQTTVAHKPKEERVQTGAARRRTPGGRGGGKKEVSRVCVQSERVGNYCPALHVTVAEARTLIHGY